MSPRQEVSVAFAALLETFLNFPVERNKGEPADLTDQGEYVCVLDGPEEAEEIEEQTGLAIHTMQVGVAVYVGGDGVADTMNATLTKIRQAVKQDRTLDGMLWGYWSDDADVPYFDGLRVGALADWDAFTTIGASPGGYFLHEFVLRYAVRPDDDGTLIRPADFHGEGHS